MCSEPADPSEFLDHTTVAVLRAAAGEAEASRRLHERQLAIIHEQRWFKLFVPAAWGGLGLTLPQALALEEALAWADGSTAWVVTLCGGAGWFVGFVDPAIRDELFVPANCCLAGSGAATGTADEVEGGYVVNGTWSHASGAEHATAFTANCQLTRGGEPLLDAAGGRRTAALVFLPGEVSLRRTWNSVGLAATGSHGFAVEQCFVPTRRCFQIEAHLATLPGMVYRYPFQQLAESTLAVNLSGMAIRFLELAADFCSGRTLTEAQARLAAARRALFHAVEESLEILESSSAIPASVLAGVSDASQQLATTARVVVDNVYPFCGLRAADLGTEINRVWRHIHTASQHALLRPASD